MTGALAEAPVDAFAIEDLWDDLISYIEDGRVVPIVGEQLLFVESAGRTIPLYQDIAEKLIERLKLPKPAAGETPSLNRVVCDYLAQRGRREDVYPRIRAILREMPFAPPEALRKLARIRDFSLFISLTFDSLLVDALNQERHGGRPEALQLSYAPNRVVDLPSDADAARRTIVYHLLGKASSAPDYVITEEDTLEFLYSMQSEGRRPQVLFDNLRDQHLLFIGCNFSDWLARFVIRTAKSRQLSLQRPETEFVVAPEMHHDANLVLFLQHFSYSTKLISQSPLAFVDELWQRWSKRHPVAETPTAPVATARVAEPDADDAIDAMPRGAIFISYASGDVAAVSALKEGLELSGLEVWFDKAQLQSGDDYAERIRRNIRACSLFVPVVSATTEDRLEGFFRREWRWADERWQDIAEGVPFIIPVTISGCDPETARVPEAFRKVQWTRLPPDGTPTEAFAARLVAVIRALRKRERS